MKHPLLTIILLKPYLHLLAGCCTGTEFRQNGDFVLGGLFDVHYTSKVVAHNRPEAVDCSSQDFVVPSYRRFQTMRFAIEEINNSSTLLPNVSLGYEIFDHCSSIHNFPSIFQFISLNNEVPSWYHGRNVVSEITAVVGPFSSAETTTIAPLLMMKSVPTISYGAGSSAFSEKVKFPSFMRTVHSNRDLVEVIVNILLHYNWQWVAFLNSKDAYGNDGLDLFRKRITHTAICLAYSRGIDYNTDASEVIKQIESQKVHVVVVFVPEGTAEHLIGAITQLNITKKVWVAVDAWSLNKKLPKMKGIQHIGTVMGVSQPTVHIPGFNEFIYSTEKRCKGEPGELCNQYCQDCESLTPEDVISSDPSFSFNVYTAVYAIAYALHNMLQCGNGECQKNTTLHNYKVLAELSKSNFTLLHETIQFDENYDPKFGSYTIVFWNSSGEAENVGFYGFNPSDNFYINTSKIEWHTKRKVPVSLCSSECSVGYAKEHEGLHKCCFTCHLCPNGTYIDVRVDEYNCLPCGEDEWSPEGSTTCIKRSVEFVPFEHAAARVIVFGAVALVGLSLLTSVLFAINYNTPVVRSAGGPMCFLILGCLCLSSISVFFYFGTPTTASCLLRYFPFLLFFSICLACFVVRSFQIVCIFKIAAKYPSIQRLWMKYHGQWLVITLAFTIQATLLIFGYSFSPPLPLSDTGWDQSQIILSCGVDFKANTASTIVLLILCGLCFIFSYMGKDLPKNYNEAKSITFCLLLIIMTWVIFATQFILYQGKYIQTLNALAVVSSLYAFLLWYFLPKCYIIIFQPQRNTPQHFQGLIQNYTKTISQ